MTQSYQIPANNPPFQNINPIVLSSAGVNLHDGYIVNTPDGLVSISRPGLNKLANFGTNFEVNGSFEWDAKGITIFVSGGRVFKMTSKEGAYTEITGDKLNGDLQATFVSNGKSILIANGENMVYTNGDSLTETVPDPDAPKRVSHVTWVDGFALAFERGTDFVRYTSMIPNFTNFLQDFSNPDGFPKIWNPGNFFQAQRSPDGLLALTESNRIVLAPGQNSMESFGIDGIAI